MLSPLLEMGMTHWLAIRFTVADLDCTLLAMLQAIIKNHYEEARERTWQVGGPGES